MRPHKWQPTRLPHPWDSPGKNTGVGCRFLLVVCILFPCSSNGKESACDAGDEGSIPGSGRSSGEGHGNPLQYSCLENSMGGEAWRATVRGVAKSQTQLSDYTHTQCVYVNPDLSVYPSTPLPLGKHKFVFFNHLIT